MSNATSANVSVDELRKLAEEPLLPELQPYLQDHDMFGQILHHPLVVQLPTVIPGAANVQYRWKMAKLKEYAEADQWDSYVFTYERGYRMQALMTNWHRMPEEQRGPIAAEVWIDSENLPQYVDEWDMVFNTTTGDSWMLPEEREALAKLPDEITVYRGVCDDTHRSWTLHCGVAKFFANRGVNGSTGEVLQGVVKRENVFAYLTRRGEDEILVAHPDDVKHQREVEAEDES